MPRRLSLTSATASIRRPIPNSYWATPLLLACEYPWSPSTPRPKLDALLSAGVRVFIDLTESGELLQYETHLRTRASALGLPPHEISAIEYHRFPIRDRCLPSNPKLIPQIMSLLESCRTQNRKAAIHCRGGIGRTGTVVGCWLVQSGLARDGKEALSIIAREWKNVEKCKRFPKSPETGPQWEFVRDFQKMVTFGEPLALTVNVNADPDAAQVSLPAKTRTVARLAVVGQAQ